LEGEKLELWQHLCAQAAVEQDPQKLMELVREIDRLLGEKMDRLTCKPDPENNSAVA
jgi:hypothetical protein